MNAPGSNDTRSSAFPHDAQPHCQPSTSTMGAPQPGLTKRELFAAMAMQGMLACDRISDTKCAAEALAHADALLAALDVTQENNRG